MALETEAHRLSFKSLKFQFVKIKYNLIFFSLAKLCVIHETKNIFS